MDATFNTNSQKFLLFVAAGVTNTRRTFPVAFSFAPTEAECSFDFFFDTINEIIFDDCPRPRVSLSDQSKGLLVSLPKYMPDCQIQLCNWHACGNIDAKYRQSRRGYPYEQRQLIYDAAWQWVLSPDLTSFEANREALLELFLPAEKKYFWED